MTAKTVKYTTCAELKTGPQVYNIPLGLDNRGIPQPPCGLGDDERSFYLSIVKRHPQGIIVEMGVLEGRSLSHVLPWCKGNNCKVYAIDPWQDWSSHLCDHHLPEAELIYQAFTSNMQQLGFLDYVNIIRKDSVEAARDFEDSSVDVAFIDTLHTYEHTKKEIIAWWPKIKVGGELFGHDYNSENLGLIKAVNEAFGKPDVLHGCMWLVKKTHEGRLNSETLQHTQLPSDGHI